jgi:hypothetical protein
LLSLPQAVRVMAPTASTPTRALLRLKFTYSSEEITSDTPGPSPARAGVCGAVREELAHQAAVPPISNVGSRG